MAALLTLVHSPLVGPETWDLVATELRDGGFEVAVPDLTPTVADGPPYAARQIAAVADCVGGRPTVLVGHSGAGPLLGSIADALDDVHGCVFVDAGLPRPGESSLQNMPPPLAEQLLGMAVDGWLPPWTTWWGSDALRELVPDAEVRARFVAGCPRLPLAMFEEPWPPSPGWPERPSAYLCLSDAYQDPADHARRLGWPVVEVAGQHLALLAEPERMVELLLGLLARLDG